MAKQPTSAKQSTNEEGRTARKRRAIMDAGAEVFLRDGYLGASVDEIAQRADVSKQTIYTQFFSKEALFLEIVSGLTNAGSDAVHNPAPEFAPDGDLRAFLEDYANRQLGIVLTPRLMQLRRVVIGETTRFPALGTALYESGPKRAMAAMTAMFQHLSERGLLRIDDAAATAAHFNWLVMSQPLNQAMLLGDAGIPDAAALQRHASEVVSLFLAAYGDG